MACVQQVDFEQQRPRIMDKAIRHPCIAAERWSLLHSVLVAVSRRPSGRTLVASRAVPLWPCLPKDWRFPRDAARCRNRRSACRFPRARR